MYYVSKQTKLGCHHWDRGSINVWYIRLWSTQLYFRLWSTQTISSNYASCMQQDTNFSDCSETGASVVKLKLLYRQSEGKMKALKLGLVFF
jgi:hypothetical protein